MAGSEDVGGSVPQTVHAEVLEELRLTRLELAKAREDLEAEAEKVAKLRRGRAKADREADILAKALSDALVRHTRQRLKGRRARLTDRKLPSSTEWTQVSLLRQSLYFWPGWYLRKNLDVAEAGIEPALHFLRNGYREDRDPSPNFVLRRYLRSHSDLEGASVNPLVHALESGDAPPVKHKRKKLHS
ncbi:hypothetical protein [Nocardioides iriomotensis]|uniref:Uncharacterized protein n=1 Tax=Nocardioides iriomotensis TaxID=715784 RepID=A0A4V1Z2I2_9ACTN|nr:hypothetical protein [Nocardioides iriomotensis]RYU14496.1 hypothetical protein ETU37_02910 [Nocardioides iriomotensis]